MKINNKFLTLIAIIPLLLISMDAQAGATVGALDSMFANFKASAEAITKLVKFASYIIGLFLVIGSIFKFAQLGSNPQLSPKTPITMFFVGIGIFSLTSAMSIVSQTMAMGSGGGAILMPSAPGMGAVTAAGLHGVLLFIRMVGFIAFVRGWLLLNQAGQGKEGVIGRGWTHIGGGVAAINVDLTAKILGNSFGWDTSFLG